MRIGVLALYFGNLPAFSQLFLASCNKNREVDFLLVGDAWETVKTDVPPNCHVNAISLDELKERIRRNTGFNPTFSSPYKVCDYKPTLGEVFHDDLLTYDYWGFCDIDIMLGRISSFIPNLAQYDIFSTHRDYLSGPLFLFRNTENINGLYRKSADVKRILETNDHFSFTECARVWGALSEGQSILEVDTETESMTEVIVKAEQAGEIKTLFKTYALEPLRGFGGNVEINDGQVLMNGSAYIHYHHLHNKGSALYTYPDWHWRAVPDIYLVNRFGVYDGWSSLQIPYRFQQFCKKWKKRAARLKPADTKSMRDDNALKLT